MKLSRIRAAFDITDKATYLNNAFSGPLPRHVAEAATRVMNEKQYGSCHWDDWEDVVIKTRKTIARLINASPEEIAFCRNTSEGLGIVTNGIQYETGSNLVVSDLEFPSGVINLQLQAKKHNLEVRMVKNRNGMLPIKEFEEQIDKNTSLVLLSHVSFLNGYKTDLHAISKLCREHEAHLLTDATQSIGAMRLDVEQLGVDFLAGNGYKWLLAPIATGFLYVKKGVLDELDQSVIGYRAVKDMMDSTLRDFESMHTAARFEHGQLNFSGYAGLLEAIEFLERVGLDHIEKRIIQLTGAIIDGVEDIKEVWLKTPPQLDTRSGIISIGVKDPVKLQQYLQERSIIVTQMLDLLRISPHFYNTMGEVNTFLTALQEFCVE
jgi:selenocysteine lyase/cysteine desulfurase